MNIFSKKIELYDISKRTGQSTILTLTSNSRDVTFEGKRYVRSTISSSSIKKNTALEKQTLTVSLDLQSEEGQYFVGSSIENHVYLKLYEYNGSEASLHWRGRLTNVKAAGEKVSLTFEQATTRMQKNGLHRKTSKICPYSIYDRNCGVGASGYGISVKIISNSGRVITFSSEHEDFAENDFSGGFVELVNGDLLYIESNKDFTFTLFNSGFDVSSIIDTDVIIYKGCDKSPKTCRDKFNNLENCGAFALMPDQNPFEGAL